MKPTATELKLALEAMYGIAGIQESMMANAQAYIVQEHWQIDPYELLNLSYALKALIGKVLEPLGDAADAAREEVEAEDDKTA